ncbi:MAG: site-specific integrase [Acidobacteriaceae bacterium]
MANRAVTLVRNCKTDEGWRRYPVVIAKNGRVKPHTVLVDGMETRYPLGTYQIRRYNGKAPQYESVGTDAARAWTALQRAVKVTEVKHAAAEAGIQIVPEEGRTQLAIAFKKFHTMTVDHGSLVAADHYERAVESFLQHSGLVYADDLAADHVTRWIGWMRKQGYADRTIFNSYCNLRAFFLHLKMKDRLPRAPRYEEQLPEVYTEQEIQAFFAAVAKDPYHTVIYSIALMCGLREQELMHIEWQDVDWQQRTLRIRAKAQWDFKVKDSEERDVPIPAPLIEILTAWHKERPKHKLITGTKGDKPNRKLLRMLKRIVYAAKLNCGACDGCRGKHHECHHWWLHKFRATYITRLHRGGLDLRTVMSLSGHSDLESVMRYLRPAEGMALQSTIDGLFTTATTPAKRPRASGRSESKFRSGKRVARRA